MAVARRLEGCGDDPTTRARLGAPVPIRLGIDEHGNNTGSALAPGTTVAADKVAYERVFAAGVTKLYVTCKLTDAHAGTHTLKIYPLMAAGYRADQLIKDDTLGTRHEVNVSDGIAVLSTTAQEDEYTTKGEALFDIEIDTDGAQAADIDYVEVYGI